MKVAYGTCPISDHTYLDHHCVERCPRVYSIAYRPRTNLEWNFTLRIPSNRILRIFKYFLPLTVVERWPLDVSNSSARPHLHPITGHCHFQPVSGTEFSSIVTQLPSSIRLLISVHRSRYGNLRPDLEGLDDWTLRVTSLRWLAG